MDAVVRRYAPNPPREGWAKNLLIGALVVWLVGSLAYGIPLINRCTNVYHTQVVAEKSAAYDRVLRTVAGQGTAGGDELNRLAATVVRLRGNGYPNVAALRAYTVYPGQFPAASDKTGRNITTQTDPVQDYGHFTDSFILDVVEATPGQVQHAIVQPSVRIWGNFRWQWLAESSGLLWVVIGLVCLVLWLTRRMWEARFERNFLKDMTPEGKEALDLLRDILAHPNMRGYYDMLNQAEALLEEVRHGYTLEKSASGSDIPTRLRRLQEIFEAGQQAYNR